jgi:twitching motility two-component system response regulator PilG
VDNKKTLKIMPIDLAPIDLQVVKSLCWVSTSRLHAYAICAVGENPDFYLVDGDKTNGISQVEAARQKHFAPVIVIANSDAVAGKHYILRRPILASRILAAFDDLASRVLGYTPELTIGDEPAKPAAGMPVMINKSSQSTLHLGGSSGMERSAVAPRLGKALVVDDSPTVRKQLELSLELLGIGVDVAEDGETAMKKIALGRYDIIFLDVVLPGMDGYQICKAIKHDSASKSTPVIMLTGKSSPFDRIKGSLAGCNSYLTKPVDNETFREVVKKYLGTSPINATSGGQAVEA